VHVRGGATIKNSIVGDNHIALLEEPGGALTSAFNDVYGNPVGYSGLTAGGSDLSSAVTFADYAQRDLRLLVAQSSTDKGDPADAADAEPLPNGGRINLGAFGGTADAETTATSTAVPGTSSAPNPTSAPSAAPAGELRPDQGDAASGCAVAGDLRSFRSLAVALLGLAILRRRRR